MDYEFKIKILAERESTCNIAKLWYLIINITFWENAIETDKFETLLSAYVAVTFQVEEKVSVVYPRCDER